MSSLRSGFVFGNSFILFKLLVVFPGPLDAGSRPPPPLVDILHMVGLFRPGLCVVEEGAEAAEELSVDHLPRPFPAEVFIVQIIVCVQKTEILGQLLGAGEVVHVDEGLLRGASDVVLLPGAHHDREDVVLEAVHEELLRDVVNTVGVLEREVKLVFRVEDFVAIVAGSGALLCSTTSVDIHINMFTENMVFTSELTGNYSEEG